TTLSGLRDGDSTVGLPATTDDNIIAQLDKVKSLYEELKPVFAKASEGSLDDTSLGLLAEKNVPLLVEMNKAVKMYEAAAKDVLGGDQQSAVVINLAGRQRMLTQKMTKEALLVHLGVNVEANSENLTVTTTMFDTTLKGLVDGNAEMGLPGTKDPEILAQLGKVKALWDSVLPVVSNGSLNDGMLTDLSTSNVTLLKEMNKAVGMYAEAAK
ncbi:MAG: type IV pili methyl-accepting chemotaxis transducer N-terminal domain-containing protein, partial [Planctomycetota bacterium]